KHLEIPIPNERSAKLLDAANANLATAKRMNFDYWKEQIALHGNPAREQFFLEYAAWTILLGNSNSRLASLALNESNPTDNYAVILEQSSQSFSPIAETTRQAVTMQVVMNSLPVPSTECHWNKLTAFKKDEKTRSELLRFRNWVRKISS